MAFNADIEKLERRWMENPLGLTFAPLAEAYRKAGDIPLALERLEQGLAQFPDYVPAHIVRGRCYLDNQSDTEAEQAFARVTELDPENVIALRCLAEISERAGRLQEAIRRLEMLLYVDRNNEEARGQLDRVKELVASGGAAAAEPAPAPAPIVAEAPKPEPVAAPEPVAPPMAAPEPPPSLSFAPDPLASTAALVPSLPETSFAPPEPLDIEVEQEHVEPSASAPAFNPESLDDLEIEDTPELTGTTKSEFQLDSDAETLTPSNERIADIVLGTEPPGEDLPAHQPPPPDTMAAAGTDSVDALLGSEYSSLLAYRDEVMAQEHAEPASSHAPEPDVSDKVDGFVPVGADVLPPPPAEPFQHQSFLPPPPAPEPEPVFAPEPEPEPVAAYEPPVPEPEPEPEPVLAVAEPESEPEPEPEPEPAVVDEPELVVTETMAEIFLRQGHRELALAVYQQLAQRDPANDRIASAVASLTPEPAAPPPAPEPEPVPQFAAHETGGLSVGQLFGSLLSAARPTPAAAIHPPAIEPPRAAGEPTRVSQDPLSLSSVFGEESPARPAGVPEPATGEPSFDEFFAPATGSSADTELPRTPGSEAGAPAQGTEDLEQFNSWLRGLKR